MGEFKAYLFEFRYKAHNSGMRSKTRVCTHIHTNKMSDTQQLKTCAMLPDKAVHGILTRALLFKTAGRGAAGPYFIMLFKGPIRLQLLNGKACKSNTIHVKDMEKAQQLLATAHYNTVSC